MLGRACIAHQFADGWLVREFVVSDTSSSFCSLACLSCDYMIAFDIVSVLDCYIQVAFWLAFFKYLTYFLLPRLHWLLHACIVFRTPTVGFVRGPQPNEFAISCVFCQCLTVIVEVAFWLASLVCT